MIIWLTGQPGSGKTTLAKRVVANVNEAMEVFHLDGDDLRDIYENKDYSEKGRRANIELAMNIARYLDNKGCEVVCSLVSPYKDMREQLKSERDVKEFYIHTSEIRGREDYFAKGYEPPVNNFVDIDTTNRSIEECVNEILNVYRPVATLAPRTSMVNQSAAV